MSRGIGARQHGFTLIEMIVVIVVLSWIG